MHLRSIILVVLAVAASTLTAQSEFEIPQGGAGFEEPLAGRVASIRADAIAAHIAFLASPSMEGRGLGTRGLENALNYAEASLRLAGIAGFGDAGYAQQVPLRKLTDARASIEIETREGAQHTSRRFTCGVDCIASPQPPQTLTAPIVFVGHGIRESALGYDDYAGLDVRGRVVMMLAGVPTGERWQSDALRSRYASSNARTRWAAKLEAARERGAVAVLAVEGDGFGAGLSEALADEEVAFRSYDHEKRHEPPMLVRVSRSVACAVAGEEIIDASRDGRRRNVPPSTATIRIEAAESLLVSRNVLGIIRGADETLREEALVLGAHIDHLGIAANGQILHGADDNASGVAALLEIAKAFASSPVPPRRTIVFAFWTGEEEGRFGSAYYVRHPRWPLAKTVANLNLDMIGHPWLLSEIRTVVTEKKLPDAEAFLNSVNPETFVEAGLPRGVPALEAALRASARRNGLPMHLDFTDGKEGGSDYRDFARANVPFIRFFGNFFPDYHKTGDTSDRIDPQQVERVARFAFATAWELANR